ncbi:DNA replication/repair protein RecF [Corynebacterium sp. 320]|uniref:DNA replication/repair protein RecF n=1 Tax=Corynebacterium TaxID=1716 RepID=UPI00125CD055|nr:MULTISPECIES: DNA replication/repair protein RecF [Corynebacterium]KAB1502803.1 DNA replication/repair protein RecF [Corynebacterium sp. 320]KAB1550455.1 DNA replication/repair protein RecF [Corynebacterium sp. 319]KAB1554814.1 DNA replication/repair protein RecF [Corynebacterium sp. 321]KAB3526466.1 DNA replication/repair protein RecF [Corynebacterium sp. 250]KAB3539786.1 DNA replication/repair protein RecF [Corynebacterium sp. 366]
MYVRRVQLADFRSWAQLDLELHPGVSVFSGPNGHGKTNIVEALGYLAHLSSHRINSDAALVREQASVAKVSATAVNDGRELTASLAIRPHGANKAHINRTAMPSQRDLLGIVRTTLFSPEDLALVRGEPEQRRSFLDTIMVARYPRLAGVKSEYDKVLRQRNALLKSPEPDNFTLEVWDAQLAALGGQLMSARVQIVHDIAPHLQETYHRLAPESRPAHLAYSSTIDAQLHDVGVHLGESKPDVEPALLSPDIAEAVLLEGFAAKRSQELDRGTTLLGPHRDDVVLMLGTQPAKGYASHGESWSFALSLRLAAFFMQQGDGAEPIVILDDVFAELDTGRRQQLVHLLDGAEQVLITAAVDEDIPADLRSIAHFYSVEAAVTEEGRISTLTPEASTESPEE